MMVAVGVFSIAGAALATIFVFTIRSFAAVVNYADLDKENRIAMDKLTREIRSAKQVTGCTSNSLTILDENGSTVTYSFNPINQQMTRIDANGSSVLLTNCNLLSFSLFQRNPMGGSYDVYPVATNNWQKTVKVIQLTWRTSRGVSGTPVINSENIQTARIVIRKQQD
jgi:hypothetical protein